jgi:cytochrome c-type biogenesis protein CcmH
LSWLVGIGAVVVTVLAIAGVLLPWWRPSFRQRHGLRRGAANVAAYKTRLVEIDADVAAGVVLADASESLKAETAARLVRDAEAAPAETQAPSSRRVPILAALALAVLAVAWYGVNGGWRTQALVDLAKTDPEAARTAGMDQMIAQLEKRVRESPDDADSWAWLGVTYRSRERHADAAQAFGRASAIKGEQDADLLAQQGEALAYAQDRSMDGAPAAKFAQALALAPNHPQALWYAGIAALQSGDDRGAIAHWEKLAAQDLPADDRATLEHSLAQLRARNGIKAPAPIESARAPSVVTLHIKVQIAPELARQVQPGDTLFVYAVDPNGPPMPLAVQRLPAASFPVETTLDDTMGPMPTRKLSSVDRWRVVARVSKSGSAMPQSGDLQGELELLRKDAGKPVQILIRQARP